MSCPTPGYELLANEIVKRDARIERLEAVLMKARKFIDYELPSRGKTMLVAELDAALGKEG